MIANKLDIDLKGVPQTLLLPLLSRAKFSTQSYSPLQDKRALELTRMLNCHPLFKNVADRFGVYCLARAYHFDQAIKQFLQRDPQAVIVNLGAGLETAFERVDNGKLIWIDLDLPEVIALRKKLLPFAQRVHNIEKSILDFSWMNDIKHYGQSFFFFAGGLFMYFTKREVKSLFLKMSEQFQNAELIFDSLSAKMINRGNNVLQQANLSDCTLQWGLDDVYELEQWSSTIKILAQFPIFKKVKSFRFPLSLRLQMLYHDFTSKNRMVHLKLIR